MANVHSPSASKYRPPANEQDEQDDRTLALQQDVNRGFDIYWDPEYLQARAARLKAREIREGEPEPTTAKAGSMTPAEKEHLLSTIAGDLASPAFRHIDDDPKR